MNKHIDENLLYIAPYLDETDRISKALSREIRQPKNKGAGKLGDILNLLNLQEDIASTHALFLKLDKEHKQAIREGHYTLFLDETIEAIEPYKLTHKDDIPIC